MKRQFWSSCSTSIRLGLIALTVITAVGGSWSGQSGHNLERPAHWKVRYDDAQTTEERRFVVMRPGWHVFAGPGGVFWDPGSFASGNYSVSSTIYLFPEGDPEESGSARLDAPFGLFLAGRDLEGDAPVFVSFQIDGAGRFRVAEHSGGDIRDLAPWTEHEGIATLGEDATGPVENVLAVDARADEVVFLVNDDRVAALPAERLPLDGVIGIRAGAGLSLHVTEIEIGPNRRGE